MQTFATPTVTAFSPISKATDVSVKSNLTLTFNTDVKAGAGNTSIKKSSDNSIVEQFNAATNTWLYR